MNKPLGKPVNAATTPAKRWQLSIGAAVKWLWSIIVNVFTGQSAKFRITMGLVGILASLVLTADLIGLIPDRKSAIRESRVAIAESIAVNTTAFISQSDLVRLQANLSLVVERNNDVLSAAVRRGDGEAVVKIGDHEQHWKTLKGAHSTHSQLQVPIWAGDNKWGQLELSFRALENPGWTGFITNPFVLFISFLSISGFVIFYFYLGKMLTQLNPSQAIPNRVRSTLDTIAEGLLVVDSRERVVLANQAFASLVGKAADDLLGYQVSDFHWTSTKGKKLKSTESPWHVALQEGNPQMNTMLRLQINKSKRRTFMANCSPILASGGKVGGVLISFDDVTALEKKEIQLRKSKDEADAANRSKSEFLANMSHEIRTPMNAILGFTELLKRGYGRNAADTAKHLNTIHSSGKHLLEIINDILDLAKVEAGNLTVEQIPCSPHTIIHEMITVLGVKAWEKGTAITFETKGEIPETIQSDPVRFRQIITNLVGNSIKFTERGRVKVVARLVKNDTRPQMAIDVMDTGIGMTPEQMASIFNPFEQADSSVTRRFGGTGLGLSISKKFAEALGGGITIRSELGKGSIFTLMIDTGSLHGVKMLKPDDVLREHDTISKSQKSQWVFPPARVLVVDDGVENRELVKLVLENAGLTVDTAENGKSGAKKALGANYDMILMDISMPVMDGFTAVRLLREKGLTLPIMALTAHAMGDVEQKCLHAGYTGFLTKPIDIDGLIKAIADYLGGYKKDSDHSNQAEQTNVTSIPAENNRHSKMLISSMSAENPRIRVIIEKFIFRLNQQVNAMHVAWEADDFNELAGLAHWLKGAAGTVGFADFTEPATTLEQLAKAKDKHQSSKLITRLKQLAERIVIEKSAATDTGQQLHNSVTAARIPDKVVSSLFVDYPQMQPVIRKFVAGLNKQLEDMDNAMNSKNFGELARLAHKLKGSGGSVGFELFTELGQNLEEQAKLRNEALIKVTMTAFRLAASRIDLPNEHDIPSELQKAVR